MTTEIAKIKNQWLDAKGFANNILGNIYEMSCYINLNQSHLISDDATAKRNALLTKNTIENVEHLLAILKGNSAKEIGEIKLNKSL